MRITATRCLLLITAVLIISHGAKAQPPAKIQLHKGSISFDAMYARTWIDSFRKASPPEKAQVILKLPARPNEAAIKSLLDAGIFLADYIGSNSWTAIISPSGNNPVLTDAYIAPMPAMLKWSGSSAPMSGSADLIVSLISPKDYNRLAAGVKAMGGKLNVSPLAAHGVYAATIPATKIPALAAQPFVKSIGKAADIQPLNLAAQRATKMNLAHAPVSQGGYGLLGDSIAIGVGDNIPGIFHVDTRDRVVNFNNAFAGFTNHGQHVNGTVGGAGTYDPAAEGFAPHAQLIDHLYDLVWARTGTMQQDFGMSVTNNSYASVVNDCNFAGVYDIYAQTLDTIALQFPNVLHVFAAGNDGQNTCGAYPTGFGTVTGGFQPAKNVLVVGNVTRQYASYYNSSRGPTKDGRIKPEIVTTGSDVYSCGKYESYIQAGATSFSSPQVSGAAGLLQQRYKQLHGSAYPPADLIKCLLLNGAMDIGNPGPDYTNGFGVLNVARSLKMIDSARYLSNSITSGAAQTSGINVPPGTGQLKVMLYWHDVPAGTLADSQLINDLDLEVSEPNTTLHRPLILNATPSQILNNAAEGADHLNNVEQIVVSNPAAGSYSVKVKSGTITGSTQRYVIAYDLMPDAVQLTFPNTGATVKAGDPLRIYWDASPGSQSFIAELSTNGGSTWTVLGTMPAGQHFFETIAPNISSEQCRVRITRGGQQSISGNFVINFQPALSLSAVQCPGYMNLQWSAVPNATAYQVLVKKGAFLQPEAIVAGTSYSMTGLSTDSIYYAAVQPLINGVPGYRSTGVKRQPNTGTCTGTFSDGDLAIDRIISPQTGRQGTSTQLTASENLVLLVSNRDDAPAASYRISYRVNNSAWQSVDYTNPIAAISSSTITIPGLNLSVAGIYTITVAITNLSATDVAHANDTLIKVVRQLANPPLNIAAGITDDFETSGAFSITRDSTGITAASRWDYYNSMDSCRIRSFVTSDVLISGARSISLDAIQNIGNTSVLNFFTGTFNAQNYSAGSSEVRFQFDYKLHGKPQSLDSNAVWVRGSDTQPWVLLYRYDTSVVPGVVTHSGTLSLTSALLAANQDFTSSTQIRFGQRDTALIALNDYGNGLTLDNVKMYIVQNDVALNSVESPAGAPCALGATAPLTVTVKNGVAATQQAVAIAYQLDGGPVLRDTIPTIAGNSTITYTFPQLLNTAAPGLHTLNVWIVAAGDTYALNDSIIAYTFRNEPLIKTYPYYESFDSNDGYYYAGGLNSSWAYGTPSSPGVHNAASSARVWKTSLSSNYNNNETSFLNSPCFDTHLLTRPTLSFAAVINVESCGANICDAAWMEYSVDGGFNWVKLGATGGISNWYNDTVRAVWQLQGDNTWHVSSVALPATPSIRLRWALISDAGTEFEGLAIDDVRIYDLPVPPYDPALPYFIYPNPVTDGTLHIQWVAAASTEAHMVLTDMSGKKLRDIRAAPATNSIDIDLGGVARGVYMLHSTIGDKTYTDKIVVR